MGETANYEEMMANMAAMQAEAEREAKERERNRIAEEVAAMLEKPQNEWQPGCPFKLKDIVHVAGRGDGKVGLSCSRSGPRCRSSVRSVDR